MAKNYFHILVTVAKAFESLLLMQKGFIQVSLFFGVKISPMKKAFLTYHIHVFDLDPIVEDKTGTFEFHATFKIARQQSYDNQLETRYIKVNDV